MVREDQVPSAGGTLIQLLMVMENRPADPGSIQGSHRPISFIRIKHRTRANDILWLSINNHIVRLVHKNHINYTNMSDVPRSFTKLSFNHSHGRTPVSYTHLTLPTNREV